MLKTNWSSSILKAALFCVASQGASAQGTIFAPGWTMNADASALRFQSVKNQSEIEYSTFATYTGTIDAAGLATVRVLMDSVDTQIDLRNVRMRFLLFETFQYPEAVITMQIDPESLADLQEMRRKTIAARYTIDLHGVLSERETDINVTLLDDDQVLVSSATPITLLTADFNLDEGVEKLAESAKVDIVPATAVTFDFIFNRAETANDFATTAAALTASAGLNAAAMEEQGDFSLEACAGRFDTMSQSNSIFFATGSARLADQSAPVLDTVLQIINRCPGLSIEVGGHTDSVGSDTANQALSEARARTVRDYLVDAGADADRIFAVGYGETMPEVPDDTPENRQRNRRIEFTIINE